MATDEIGLKATLDTQDFEAGTRRLDAMIKAIEKNLNDLERRQRESAAAAKAQADAEKKAVAEAEKAARAEETAINKRERSFRKFAIVAAVMTAAVIKGYQTMRDAAKELGDTEAIAQFEAMDAALGSLRDTVLQAGLEILKASDAIPFLTDRLQTLYQMAVIVSSALVGFTTQWAALAKAGKGYGIEDLGKPGVIEELNAIDFGAIQAQAQEAQRKAMENILAAPQSRKQVEALEKQEKETEKYTDKVRDLTIKSGQSILEAEKDYQDRSAEAWKDYISKANEIVADGIKERAKIQRAYNDKIVEAERSYQRGIESANYDHGKKMSDIERDYQDTIRNIQQTYREDALDAIRNLDAIALIRAREKRDKDLAGANQDRDRQISAEQENYARSIAELSRALADKREEAERDRQRDLDEQRQNEKDKLDEAKLAYGEQTAAIQQAFNDRIAAIRGNYSQEDIEAQAHYLNQQTMLTNHLNAMRSIMARYGMGGAVTSPVRTPGGGFRRAEGGVDIVNTPTQFTAGEAGPELAIFAPLNRALPSPIMQTVNHTGDFSHSIDAAITSSVAGLDGRIIAVVRKALSEVIR